MRIIIIGGGEIGFYLAERLTRESRDVVLIDKDAQRVLLARREFDIQVIHGEGSSPKVLMEAGIQDAQMVVAVTTSDEVNMVACLIAQSHSRVPIKIARIRNTEYINDTNILSSEHIGIDCHINPEMEAANKIDNLCQIPSAGAVIPLGDDKFRMFSVKLPDSNGLIGHKLRDLPEFSPDNKALVSMIQRQNKTLIPTGETVLEKGDVLWLVSTKEGVRDVLESMGIDSSPVKRAMIFGSGITTVFVARKLMENKIKVKILSSDRKRCDVMAEKLDDALVLHVPSVTADMLMEENISDYSAFIATGRDDEENILATLLAKRMGASKTITLLDRPTYQSIVEAVGVDNSVNRRMAAADKILQYLRKGKVQSTSSVGATGAEAIEFEALRTADAVGKPLYKIKFPLGSIVAGILRNGQAIIPRGNDIILPKDRVIVIALDPVIPKVEKVFQVKVSFF